MEHKGAYTVIRHEGAYLEHNRENFGALLKNIIGNLKSIIGPGLA